MKTYILFLKLIGIGLTIGAFSLSAQTASCKNCRLLEQSAQSAKRLNYLDENDFNKGAHLVPAFLSISTQLKDAKKLSASQKQEFVALVSNSVEIVPYDEESAVAADIAILMLDKPELNSEYQRVIKKLPESCNKQLFEVTIAEQLCLRKAIKEGRYENPGKKDEDNCEDTARAFNYESCIKKDQP